MRLIWPFRRHPVVVLPKAMSLAEYEAMHASTAKEAPSSETRDRLLALKDACLKLAKLTEGGESNQYLDIAARANEALSPQYLSDDVLARVYESLLAEYGFVEALL